MFRAVDRRTILERRSLARPHRAAPRRTSGAERDACKVVRRDRGSAEVRRRVDTRVSCRSLAASASRRICVRSIRERADPTPPASRPGLSLASHRPDRPSLGRTARPNSGSPCCERSTGCPRESSTRPAKLVDQPSDRWSATVRETLEVRPRSSTDDSDSASPRLANCAGRRIVSRTRRSPSIPIA